MTNVKIPMSKKFPNSKSKNASKTPQFHKTFFLAFRIAPVHWNFKQLSGSPFTGQRKVLLLCWDETSVAYGLTKRLKNRFLSFPRRRESSLPEIIWTPAFAGVTTFNALSSVSCSINLAAAVGQRLRCHVPSVIWSFSTIPLFPFRIIKYATGTMNRVKKVEAKRPKISAHARPEKTGSSVMGQAPRAVVAAVSTMGRSLTAPL